MAINLRITWHSKNNYPTSGRKNGNNDRTSKRTFLSRFDTNHAIHETVLQPKNWDTKYLAVHTSWDFKPLFTNHTKTYARVAWNLIFRCLYVYNYV